MARGQDSETGRERLKEDQICERILNDEMSIQ